MSIVTSSGPISFLSAYSISPTVLLGGISLNTLERLYMDGTSNQTSYTAATANPALTNVWVPKQTQITGGAFPDKKWIYSGPINSEPWWPAKLSEFRSAYNQVPLVRVKSVQTGFPITFYPTTPTDGYAKVTLEGYHTDAVAIGSLQNFWFYAKSIGAGNASAWPTGGGSVWGNWVQASGISGANTIMYAVKTGGNRNIQSLSRFYVQDLSGCGSSFDIFIDLSYP